MVGQRNVTHQLWQWPLLMTQAAWVVRQTEREGNDSMFWPICVNLPDSCSCSLCPVFIFTQLAQASTPYIWLSFEQDVLSQTLPAVSVPDRLRPWMRHKTLVLLQHNKETAFKCSNSAKMKLIDNILKSNKNKIKMLKFH